VRDTWFRAEKTGDFYGQCAELCGKEHAYMPIHVKVLSQADYAKPGSTARRRKWPHGRRPRQDLEAGRTGGPRREGLQRQLRRLPPADGKGAGPIKPLDGSRRRARTIRRRRSQILLNGAANGAMPAWKQLSDTEIAAVITYTKNSWSNQTGKLVQPAEVVAARK
jgi:cytochrome c oxidase subunit 2